MNRSRSQRRDRTAKPVNYFFKSSKNLITEAQFTQFFPDLLNRIHFWCVWRNKEQTDVSWNDERPGFMPCSTVTAKKNNIIWILFRKFFEKNVHADRVAVWHDQKTRFACKRFNSTVNVPVLSNMMARDRRSNTFFAPAIFGFINPPKTSLILKHETDFFTC